MTMMVERALLLACALLAAAPSTAVLASQPPAVSEYRIMATGATVEEAHAAATVQRWLERACGCTVPIVDDDGSATAFAGQGARESSRAGSNGAGPPPPPPPAPLRAQIAVGHAAATSLFARARRELNTTGLGEEGFVIATDAPTFSVAVSGGALAKRGCLYGAYALLERLGFGFWDANASTVPVLTTAWPGEVNAREAPALPDWRHCNNANLELQSHADFATALRDNNNGGVAVYTSRDVHKIGGGVRWASPPGFVHTSFTIVDPTELRSTHPQWFGPNQLCWTNVSLVAYVIERVKAYLDADPNATVISVSQNDGGGAGQCHTPEEDAVTKEEGSPAGPLLRAVNAVADAVASTHPGVLVETLAYTYTRVPPRVTKPRPNVVIRLSNIECEFGRPVSDPSSPANAAFAADLEAWSRVSNRTWIWTYVTDFANWVQPWPDYYTMADNIRFYNSRGVTGVYQEGQYMAVGGDLQALKSWVGTRLMWDPTLDTDALISQFATGYYGSNVTPHILAHIATFASGVNASGAPPLSIDAPYTAPHLTPKACLDALANLQDAKRAAASSSDVPPADALPRVLAVELGTMYVVLLRWGEMRAWAAAANRTWPAPESKQDALAAFVAQYRASGMSVRAGFDASRPIKCGPTVDTCHVLDGRLMPPSCGLACATVPCNHATGTCDSDCGLSEGCHGLAWFNATVANGPPPPPGPVPGPPGRRSFPDCWGYGCGPGTEGARPPSAYGDRCFPANGGSSGLGPLVCCNASIPAKWQPRAPCTLSGTVHGCWWPISAGCPGVNRTSVCPLARPYEYGDDAAGWFCCATDSGPRTGECDDGPCCLEAGKVGGCQGRAPCYNGTAAAG